MAHKASVKKALSSQRDLIEHREHCSLDPGLLAALECMVGQQVRIIRDIHEYGLYTVSESREESDDIVRMGLAGRQRLGTTAEFDSLVDSLVPHPSLTDAAAEHESEFIERLDDNGSQTGLIALAPHGGDIERHTDQQAERVASQLGAAVVSSWRCKGWKFGGGASETWHITSADIHETSFPLLNSVISRGFTHAVAFHGFSNPEVLIGGAAPTALKEEVRAAIDDAILGSGIVVRLADPEDEFGGDSPRNVVNRLTAGGANGIQIEQSSQARTHHWAAIADAVADVYRPKL